MQGQSLRICHFDPVIHDEPLCTYLSFIEELREVARTRVEWYKKRVQAAFNSRVQKRSFQLWDLVWWQADALKGKCKLEANCEGTYKIHSALPGDSYCLDNKGEKLLPTPWNICHLKKYYAWKLRVVPGTWWGSLLFCYFIYLCLSSFSFLIRTRLTSNVELKLCNQDEEGD